VPAEASASDQALLVYRRVRLSDAYAFDRSTGRLLLCQEGRTEGCRSYQLPEQTVDVIPMSDGAFGVRDALLALQKSGEALRCRMTARGELACERSEVSAMEGGAVQTRIARSATFVTARAANGDHLGCTILPGRRGARCTEASFLTQVRAGMLFGEFTPAGGLQAITFRDGVASLCDISGASPACRPVQGLEQLALSNESTFAAIHSPRTGRADLVSVSGRQLSLCRARSVAGENPRFSCRSESLEVDLTDLKVAVVVGRSVETGVPKTEALAVLPSERSLRDLPTTPIGQTFEIANVRAAQASVTSALKRARNGLARLSVPSNSDAVVSETDSTPFGARRLYAALLLDDDEDPMDVGYPSFYQASLSDGRLFSWWSDNFGYLAAYILAQLAPSREQCLSSCDAQAQSESAMCELYAATVEFGAYVGTGIITIAVVASGAGLVASGTIVVTGYALSGAMGSIFAAGCRARALVERENCRRGC
jgi:hypothetical protein